MPEKIRKNKETHKHLEEGFAGFFPFRHSVNVGNAIMMMVIRDCTGPTGRSAVDATVHHT